MTVAFSIPAKLLVTAGWVAGAVLVVFLLVSVVFRKQFRILRMRRRLGFLANELSNKMAQLQMVMMATGVGRHQQRQMWRALLDGQRKAAREILFRAYAQSLKKGSLKIVKGGADAHADE